MPRDLTPDEERELEQKGSRREAVAMPPRELTPGEQEQADRLAEQAITEIAEDGPADPVQLGQVMGMTQAQVQEALGWPVSLSYDDDPGWSSLASERPDGTGGVPGRAGADEPGGGHGEATKDPAEASRRVDLGPWLDGSYEPPKPEVGAPRDDGTRMLYASRWHTVIGPTGCGKSWLGLWHAAQELKAGNLVVYCHFEESTPGGTVGRLLQLGCTPEQIRERFVWFDCDRRWTAAEFAAELAELPTAPTLTVLDGINACCTKHGWHPNDADAVGSYRYTFATPATRLGAAVLSLGHPPKARDRQDERHGYGATGWLDEVDGVGFRLVASKTRPVGKGRSGSSSLHVVKDRYAEVEQHGVTDGDREGWSYFGQFIVDDTDPDWLGVRLAVPEAGSDGQAKDRIDRLGDSVMFWLVRQPGRRVESWTALNSLLRARKVGFANEDLKPALLRLVERGRVSWPEAKRGQGRPVSATAPEDEAADTGAETAPDTDSDGVDTRGGAGNPSGAPPLWGGGARSGPEGMLPNAPRSGPERSGAFGAVLADDTLWDDENTSPATTAGAAPAIPATATDTADGGAVGAADALFGTGCQSPGCGNTREPGELFCGDHTGGGDQ